MKTNMKIRRKDVEKPDKDQSLENCKLENLKLTGAYGSASQAEAWAKGIEARQAETNCAVARSPKRPASRRPRRIETDTARRS